VLKESAVVLTDLERRTLIQTVQNEVQGLGPLEPLLEDPSITDILVNGPDDVFIERAGVLEKSAIRFMNAQHLRTTLDRMLFLTGRRIDESSPMVDARLPSGARLHAIVPPIALKGITLSIRKFSAIPFTLQALIKAATLTEKMAQDLERLVSTGVNMLISGGTGAGKTTLLNALASGIPEDERVITLEEAAELQLAGRHVVTLEARPPNIEGQGEITLRQLLRNALRMRPDRIIVGEVRGPEVFEMLQAMNSGHGGSWATVHANSPRDALVRLENLMAMSGMGLTVDAIRRQIAAALQVIIQVRRGADGIRRIVAMSEVVGFDSGVIALEEVYCFDPILGFKATGIPFRCGALSR
jgi:pilus assembly protein CpaF